MGTETNVKTKGLDVEGIAGALGLSVPEVEDKLTNPLSFTLSEIYDITVRCEINMHHFISDLLAGAA
jgi:hypothetical protein